MSLNYKESGVDLEAGDAAVRRIAELAQKTFVPGVLGRIGHFGAFFELDTRSYQEPVLVSSVDGVGTKLKIACALGRYEGIGRDLVNHCVNDIMCSGADPLYFLDYLALGKLEPQAVAELAQGLVAACRENGCALIGGETAEMPDVYQPGEFDIAGAITGLVEKRKIITGQRIRRGDILIGLHSTGLHTNGFSLARKIVERSDETSYHAQVPELDATIGETLLAVHRSYRESIRAVRDSSMLRGIAHITGGGIVANTQRLLPQGLQVSIDWQAWDRPAIFRFLQKSGQVEEMEMRRVFNLGIGLVLVVARDGVDEITSALRALQEPCTVVGEVVSAG